MRAVLARGVPSRSSPSRSQRPVRASVARARACPRPARVSSAGPPRAFALLSRRSRSCRSSPYPGTAQRTRCRRRSGSARRWRRARCCGGPRRALARARVRFGTPPGIAAASVASPRRARSARPSGGGSNSSTTSSALSRSSTLSDPSTYARPSPSVPGAEMKCPSASGRCTKNVGASGTVAATAPPSQKRTLNGRAGNARRSSRPSGALRRTIVTTARLQMRAADLTSATHLGDCARPTALLTAWVGK